MKVWIKKILPIADILLFPFVYPAAWLLKNIRWAGVHRLPLCKNALMNVGVFPVRDHYYEPKFDHRSPSPAFFEDRNPPESTGMSPVSWRRSKTLPSRANSLMSHEAKQIQKLSI